MIKRCEICGKEFLAVRSTARFCSATCRKRNQRGYEFVGDIKVPKVSPRMSEEEILSAIQAAHQCASDLSRASMSATAPLCLSLKSVAEAIEAALRGEGL